MERKTFALTGVKMGGGDGRTLTGYASTWDRDLGNDIIEPGAFAETIAQNSGKIRLLWQHDPAEVLGTVKTLREDDRGLYIEARISSTTRGMDVAQLLADGAVDSLSIGYSAVKTRGTNPRYLETIKLFEVSVVTFPMNPQATVTGLKGGDLEAQRKELLAKIEARIEPGDGVALALDPDDLDHERLVLLEKIRIAEAEAKRR
jgi:uncharacterized protein